MSDKKNSLLKNNWNAKLFHLKSRPLHGFSPLSERNQAIKAQHSYSIDQSIIQSVAQPIENASSLKCPWIHKVLNNAWPEIFHQKCRDIIFLFFPTQKIIHSWVQFSVRPVLGFSAARSISGFFLVSPALRWNSFVKQWQAVCATAPTTQCFMTRTARHCFTPNAVSSHFLSFAQKKRGEMKQLLAWNNGKPYVPLHRPLSVLWHIRLATVSCQTPFHPTCLPLYE